MTRSKRCQRILVVEDDESIREAIQEAFQDVGYQVQTAVNGEDALKLLRSVPAADRPCFILLDLMMPVMNGWEFLLAQRADSELANIPVMIASAVAEREKVPGVCEYVKKPYDLDDLLSLVEKHCDVGGVPVSED